MKKTGIFSWFNYPLPIEERLRLIKNAGFDATSLWWAGEDRRAQPGLARKIGLEIDNIHTPFGCANDLWLPTPDGDDYPDMLCDCVRDCAEFGISTAVVHLTDFNEPVETTQAGMDRIRRLIDVAEKHRVRLAFENLLYLEQLRLAFDTFRSDYVGFCYDSGHEHCSPEPSDCLCDFGGRLFAVHLDDNFGDDDTHLLPYDGTVDWDAVKAGLSRCRDVEYLTLEVNFNASHEKSRIYQGLSAEEYLQRAHASVLRLME